MSEAYTTATIEVMAAISKGLRAGLSHAEAAELLRSLAGEFESCVIAVDPWGDNDSRVDPELRALGLELFGDAADFRAWLAAPARALGGERPIFLLGTLEGRARVVTLIHQLRQEL